MRIKSCWADIQVWVLNKLYRLKLCLQDLAHDLKQDENPDLRIFAFVVVYILFSAVGAYNFAHLAAFLYIVWLLERQHGN